MAWALRESNGDQTLAAAAVAAAMAAAAAGADSSAAADAGRREIARLRAQRVAPAPPYTAPAWTAQPRPATAPPPQRPVVPVALPRPPEATVALVLGILSPLTCGVVLGPIAIWYGRRAQQQIRANPAALGGEGLATAGIWLGAIGIVVFVIELVVALSSGTR